MLRRGVSAIVKTCSMVYKAYLGPRRHYPLSCPRFSLPFHRNQRYSITRARVVECGMSQAVYHSHRLTVRQQDRIREYDGFPMVNRQQFFPGCRLKHPATVSEVESQVANVPGSSTRPLSWVQRLPPGQSSGRCLLDILTRHCLLGVQQIDELSGHCR